MVIGPVILVVTVGLIDVWRRRGDGTRSGEIETGGPKAVDVSM